MNPTNPTNFQAQIEQIIELINKNNSGLIVLPANPTADAIAASTALYLALTKKGKSVSLVCSTTPQSDLTGADKIQQSLTTGGDNLVVSFPFVEGAIDKVDYNVQGGRFNLFIIPREGNAKLEPKQVEFSYTGGKIEFIFTIDVPNLNSIGPVYQQNQREFDGKNIVNIDRHLINNNYGVVNYVNKASSSTSELILNILEAAQIQIDKEIATNLYAGLMAATNGFTSYSVNADTFQIASKLLRYGATKRPMNRPAAGGFNRPPANRFQQPPFNQMRQPAPFPSMAPMIDEDEDFDEELLMPPMNTMPPMNPAPQSFSQPMPVHNQPTQSAQAAPQRSEQQTTAIEDVEKESVPKEQAGGGTSSWLKPKIFPGKGLI